MLSHYKKLGALSLSASGIGALGLYRYFNYPHAGVEPSLSHLAEQFSNIPNLMQALPCGYNYIEEGVRQFGLIGKELIHEHPYIALTLGVGCSMGFLIGYKLGNGYAEKQTDALRKKGRKLYRHFTFTPQS